MRNLFLASERERCIVDVTDSEVVSTTAFDLDNNVVYIASEKVSAEGDEVSVRVWTVDKYWRDSHMFTIFSSANVPGASSQIVSLHVLPETRQLCAIMRCGDITLLNLDEDCPIPDVEGTVEPGILAAAWSPDDTLLCLVGAEAKLILMTSTFDVMSEGPLDTAEFGEDALINVGWGSKSTQFHGSLGKAAAAASQAPQLLSRISPDDDSLPRITWRGDGAYFCISSLSASPSRRVLRMYSQSAALQSTSEAVAGLEHPVSWRPSGNFIASSQRFGKSPGLAPGPEGRHDIVFFERNGLRHGEFSLRMKSRDYRIREIKWSSDSSVIALWIDQKDEGHVLQLWTTGNYHWYLKQEIRLPQRGSFRSVEWHSERPLELLLISTSSILSKSYAWETVTSPGQETPDDKGCVAVIDGCSLLLTPFRYQNVPPPMSTFQLSLPSVPKYATFSSRGDRLAVLLSNGKVELYTLNTGRTRGKPIDPVRLASIQPTSSSLQYNHILFSNRTVALLDSQDVLTVLEVDEEGTVVSENDIKLPFDYGRLVSIVENGVIYQNVQGALYRISRDTNTQLGAFPEVCLTTSSTRFQDQDLFFGLSPSSKLYLASSNDSRTIATNANSFTVASGFLIFTTTSHEAKFAPLDALADETKWESRRVERGSRIVVAVPSTMSLVLQMPRGNLETIHPRPMVMRVVEEELDRGNYRNAFVACRKHRVDLNVLVTHNEAAFLEHIGVFLEQVHEVDHINLFLTSIGRSSLPKHIIAKICDVIGQELERKDLTVYVNSILTAHVVKTPPEYEQGLNVLLRLRDTHPDLVEDALKYIIFLVDADKLFDTALGMYDFSLVLMVAQQAQEDPREYLPFLRELRALESFYQRFRIDDHLKRYPSALRNLSLAGEERFPEAVSYVERYSLYTEALEIWRGTTRYNDVLVVYGDWLFERREWREASAVFVEAGALSKAKVAYEKALDWQELFELAVRTDTTNDDLVSMGYRVAEDLTSKKRYSEAAQVLLDYSQDVREAIIALVQGNLFSEARRIATLRKSPELVADIIQTGLLETQAQLGEDLAEMREQLRKQLARLKELRVKRQEEPDEFFGVEDTALHNVDVMTDVSMAPTAFTRYTVAPSTALSKKSKVSSKTKRKAERKVGSGRKGTVDEENYIFKSVGKLVGRFADARGEASRLLPHLLQFTSEHRDEAKALQEDIAAFEIELQEAIGWIWQKTDENGQPQEVSEDTWRARMEQLERERKTNPADKVPKPTLDGRRDWALKLLDSERAVGS